METLKPDIAHFERLDQLKPILVDQEGPCLTVYLSLGRTTTGPEANDKNNALRWREAIRSIEPQAKQTGRSGQDLLASIENWDLIRESFTEVGSHRARSVAVLRSPNSFVVVTVARELADKAVCGPHFFVRPLLNELVRYRNFYLLALSNKNARLLHCTSDAADEVPLPGGVETNFESWQNIAKPDHTAVYNAMTSGTQGASGPNALAPKGSDREKKNEYLAHFYKQIDAGVNLALKDKMEPLVICGVEYELPIYRGINRYPRLVSEDVRGAPNSLKSGEMHARALEALDLSYDKKVDEALAEWNHLAGGGASNRLKDIVTASYAGRVLTLLISDSDDLKIGVFDEQSFSVKGKGTGSSSDEDLLNEAAIQTILHAGKVLVVPANKMPHGSPLAAIFRY